MLDLVARPRQGGETRLQEVVHAAGGERPGQEAAEARRDHLRARQAGGNPGADAARAGDELADRLPQVARLDGLLVLDERLADEARDLVARDRARELERRGAEHGEVERALLRGLAPEGACEQARTGEPRGIRRHDRRVRGLRLSGANSHPGTLSLQWPS